MKKAASLLPLASGDDALFLFLRNLRVYSSNVIKLVVQGRSIGYARIFKERIGKNFQRLSSKNRRRELRQKKIRENSQRAEV